MKNNKARLAFEMLEKEMEVIDFCRQKGIVGGNGIDLSLPIYGYINSPFTDSDPSVLGGAFSYVSEDVNGVSHTVQVYENEVYDGRFKLHYIEKHDEYPSEIDVKVYYDNATGLKFVSRGEFISGVGGYFSTDGAEYAGPDGYNYIDLMDEVFYDEGGYTHVTAKIEELFGYDHLTGEYHDYSRLLSEGTHYDYPGGYAPPQQGDPQNPLNQLLDMTKYIYDGKYKEEYDAFYANPANRFEKFTFSGFTAAQNQYREAILYKLRTSGVTNFY